MKERPIIFSGPMVRAILEGRKTQTRREVKPRGIDHASIAFTGWTGEGDARRAIFNAVQIPGPAGYLRCPHGVPGDRLWVREAFWQASRYPSTMPSGEPESPSECWGDLVHYAADGDPPNTPNRTYPQGLRGGSLAAPDPYASWHKRSPIHMPRKLSRITLEIESVRVQRVQDISEDDAVAEGVTESRGTAGDCYERVTAKENYAWLWDSIHGPGSWNANKWVWAITFRRVKACEEVNRGR